MKWNTDLAKKWRQPLRGFCRDFFCINYLTGSFVGSKSCTGTQFHIVEAHISEQKAILLLAWQVLIESRLKTFDTLNKIQFSSKSSFKRRIVFLYTEPPINKLTLCSTNFQIYNAQFTQKSSFCQEHFEKILRKKFVGLKRFHSTQNRHERVICVHAFWISHKIHTEITSNTEHLQPNE